MALSELKNKKGLFYGNSHMTVDINLVSSFS